MRFRKVVRSKGGDVVSAVNAVIATNMGEADQETCASGRQHVEIIQRDGHTEVRELHSDDKET